MAVVDAFMVVELQCHSIFCLGWRDFLGCSLLAVIIFVANKSSNIYSFIQQGKAVGVLHRIEEKACTHCGFIDGAIWGSSRLFTLSGK